MSVSGLLICALSGGWGIALAQFGDVGTRMYVLFFFGLSLVVCTCCVAQIRSSSKVIAVTLIAYFSMSSESTLAAAAISCAAIFCGVTFMQQSGYRDFRKLVSVVDENRRLTLTDPLTGLPNRRSYFERLQVSIDEPATAKRIFTIGIIDIDGFKQVNDTFGHHAGDEVLREAANRLENIRDGIGWAGRLGDDEFGLIIRRA